MVNLLNNGLSDVNEVDFKSASGVYWVSARKCVNVCMRLCINVT